MSPRERGFPADPFSRLVRHMSRLDELPADQKAVLQLLLKQGKSYAELGGLLRIDERAVRERALDALENLGADTPSGLNPARQDEVGDYLLGQQSAAEADTTRTFLQGSAAGRAWARAISGQLEPVARDPLPAVPDEPPEEAAAGDGAGGRKAKGAKGGERSSRLGGLAVLGVGAVLVAVVIVALLTRNGDDGSPKSAGPTATVAAPASTGSTATTGTSTTDSGQIESQINMTSPSGGDAIAVAYALNRQGQRVLGIAGQKFPATGNKFSYAVWLYTSPTRASRLGFVANGVGANGRLVTGADPTQAKGAEAARLRDQLAHLYDYKQLIITRETSANATRPGPIVVAGPIRRPAGVTG
jgi:hypothetical protein